MRPFLENMFLQKFREMREKNQIQIRDILILLVFSTKMTSKMLGYFKIHFFDCLKIYTKLASIEINDKILSTTRSS
jgi:hypothetical protein